MAFIHLKFFSPSVSFHSTPLGYRLGRCFCFAEVSNGHPHPYTGEAEVCSKPSSALNGEIKFTVLLGAKHRVAVFNA